MSRASVPSDRLAKAAAVVAGGSSVEAAAEAVGVAVSTVRRWMADPRWQPLYDRARRAAATEAGTEAVLVLRSLLRSPDDGVRARAAQTLAAQALARDRAAEGDDPDPDSHLVARLLGLGEPGDLADVTPAEFRDAVLAGRVVRSWAEELWREFGRDCDRLIGRFIETDPAAARELLRLWHLELCRGPVLRVPEPDDPPEPGPGRDAADEGA